MKSTSSNRQIDLTPMLMAGQSPFPLVESTVRELSEGESVDLLAPFEPTPLYPHLEAWGCSWHSETEGSRVRIEVRKVRSEPAIPLFVDARKMPAAQLIEGVMKAYIRIPVGECLIVHLAGPHDGLFQHLNALELTWELQEEGDGSCQIYLLKKQSLSPGCCS